MQGALDDDAAPALDVRGVGRELRREDEDRIARIEECLAEELLEDLGPRPDDDVLGPDRDAELAGVVLRDRLAERRQARRRAIVRVAPLDGGEASGDGVLRAGEGAVTDL